MQIERSFLSSRVARRIFFLFILCALLPIGALSLVSFSDVTGQLTQQAERRVRLGLVVAELVREHKLQAKPEQLQAHIEEMSQSYEKPAEVMNWYLGDRQRMADVEAVVIENNVTEFVLGRAKVIDKVLPFDELMSAA